MIVSHQHKIAFIHNPKTGGMSVEHWLKQQCPDAKPLTYRHTIARECWTRFPGLASYLSFGFVRNPWARLVSWYSMIVEYPPQGPIFPFWNYVRANATCFEDFIHCCTAEVPVHGTTESAVRPQLDHFRDAAGRQIVSYIGRYETLQHDLDRVADRCGFPRRSAPHANASMVTKDYQTYYTAETRDIVAKRFAVDIARFGYSF